VEVKIGSAVGVAVTTATTVVVMAKVGGGVAAGSGVAVGEGLQLTSSNAISNGHTYLRLFLRMIDLLEALDPRLPKFPQRACFLPMGKVS